MKKYITKHTVTSKEILRRTIFHFPFFKEYIKNINHDIWLLYIIMGLKMSFSFSDDITFRLETRFNKEKKTMNKLKSSFLNQA